MGMPATGVCDDGRISGEGWSWNGCDGKAGRWGTMSGKYGGGQEAGWGGQGWGEQGKGYGDKMGTGKGKGDANEMGGGFGTKGMGKGYGDEKGKGKRKGDANEMGEGFGTNGMGKGDEKGKGWGKKGTGKATAGEVRPGDWWCEICWVKNYESRPVTCFKGCGLHCGKCGLAKDGRREGCPVKQWVCWRCGCMQFAGRNGCRKCDGGLADGGCRWKWGKGECSEGSEEGERGGVRRR